MVRAAIWVSVAAVAAGWVGAGAQVAPSPQPAVIEDAQEPQPRETTERRDRPDNPYEAYDAGLYDEALQGFVDLQVERPDDPEVALNVGSAHYQMRNYPDADQTFARAALAQDPGVRQQALYNLGNSAYRQGRLPEAVELYKAVLEIDPDDEDAKFNLEFVRDEIRRRHEEAQKRQQEQQQQQNQQGREQQKQEEGQGADQEPQPEGQDDQQQEQQGQEEQQPQGAQDRDQDGLSDQQEESAENPTDPDDADSDDDGLVDGAEDLNRNGRLDEGETDPNRVDTDGDGIPDGQQIESGEAGSAEAESIEGLTPEEAERYLQALQEGRPTRRHAGRGRRAKGDKDW